VAISKDSTKTKAITHKPPKLKILRRFLIAVLAVVAIDRKKMIKSDWNNIGNLLTVVLDSGSCILTTGSTGDACEPITSIPFSNSIAETWKNCTIFTIISPSAVVML
jgi:hypothetical protein